MADLGDEVEDTITGFRGIVFGITNYLHGCRRLTVLPRIEKDGKYPEAQFIDEPQVKILKTRAVIADKVEVDHIYDSGGPVTVPRDNKVQDPGKS